MVGNPGGKKIDIQMLGKHIADIRQSHHKPKG